VRRDVSAADIAVSIAFTEKWADLFILHGGPFDSFCSSSTANTCIRIEQPSYQCFKIPDNSIILQLYRIDGDHVCRPDGSDGFRSDAKKEGLMHGRGDEGGKRKRKLKPTGRRAEISLKRKCRGTKHGFASLQGDG
jgi:hypothetical protein